MAAIVTNNAWGELSVPISPTSRQIVLTGGQGDRFPTPTNGVSYFYGTLISSENEIEIVRCISRSGDTLQVERGVDNTRAKSFEVGTKFECRLCAALLNSKVDEDDLTKAIGHVKDSFKQESDRVYKLYDDGIRDIKNDYATNEFVKNSLEELRTTNSTTYTTIEGCKKVFLPITGGTLTGPLEVKGESAAGITIAGGNILVKKGAATGSSGQIGGDIRAEGTIKADTFKATSDMRLKHDIEPFFSDEGLALAKAIRPVHFKWNSSDKLDVGVIAQELRVVLPELVEEDEHGMLTVNYDGVGVVALAAVLDLERKVKELQCQLES